MSGAWVEVDSELYLPEWVMRAKAKNKLAEELVRRQREREGLSNTVTPEQLARMKGNDRVPGVYAAPARPGKRESPIVIPSDMQLTADHVRDIEGMVREGGYGKGPTYRTDSMSKAEWAAMVGNFVDKLVAMRADRNKARFAVKPN